MVFEHYATEASVRARKHSEKKPQPDFVEGELVLVAKPFYEKGTGVILPQCDGPFTIARVPTAHTVILIDTLTGEPAFLGKAVAVSRIIRFHFPADWAGPEAFTAEEKQTAFDGLSPGTYIACSCQDRVHVARVERVFADQALCDITLHIIAPECRTGPWQARRWSIWTDDSGSPKREVISPSEFLCSVTLTGGALSLDSLERLVAAGVPASAQPRRDAALPRRK